MKKRLPLNSAFFHLPVQALRRGWHSDKYFVRSQFVLNRERYHPRVLMQVFAKQHGVLCGIDEALAAIKCGALQPKGLLIRALYDGDRIKPWETVMTIEGDYAHFAHLETVYLGILARRTAVATNVDRVVRIVRPKGVLFFSARFDHWSVQAGDGYAAKIGGAHGVSTDAGASWWGGKGLGTIPHALIAAYGGDTVQAAHAFAKHTSRNTPLIALVDFQNNCVKTSLEVAQALGKKLWGVRLDTSELLWDRSVRSRHTTTKGVSSILVRNVRRALNRAGFHWVKIIVSGGFTAARLQHFIRLRVPFDVAGVGSSLFKERCDFTADVVKVNGKPCAKVGRRYRPNARLCYVKL